MNASKRKHLVVGGTSALALALGAYGVGHFGKRGLGPAPLASLAQELRASADKTWTSKTEWKAAQVWLHLAQSIEYSLTGFPEPKSAAFQATIGSTAFGVFAARKKMRHSLVEPIPGAPALDAAMNPAQALQVLLTAIDKFLAFQGSLKPHFAYGQLEKNEYAWAHWMHVKNHLEALAPSS